MIILIPHEYEIESRHSEAARRAKVVTGVSRRPSIRVAGQHECGPELGWFKWPGILIVGGKLPSRAGPGSFASVNLAG
jgi:hypothetical protein